jgi:BASS family bile acid:Na+ symporter
MAVPKKGRPVGTLSSLLDVAITVFAVTSTLAVGLRYTVGQLIEPLRNAPAVIRALVANFVLVPLLVFAILQLISLDRPFAIGLVVLATAAGAPVMLKLTQAAGGNVGLSATLLVLLLPVTIVYMPIVVPLMVPGTVVSAGAITRPLVLSMLLPLALGLAVKARLGRWAERLQPIMGKAANIALVALVVLTVVVNARQLLDVFGRGAILASFLFIAGAFVIGYLLGGRDRDARIVLGLGTAQRNMAAAMVVAGQSIADARVLVMVVVVSTVSLLLFPLAGVLRRRTPSRGETGAGGDAARRTEKDTAA